MSALTVPESESILVDPPPDGFRYEWVADEGSRAAAPHEQATRRCRRPRCDGKPVMALLRSRWGAYGVTRHWWLYCADHLYGRRITNGIVQMRRLVPDEGETRDDV